jgi:hypothetical protein
MATLTLTPIKTFASGDIVTPAGLNELAQSTVALTAGSIVDADISASAAFSGSKLANGSISAAKLDGAQTGSAPIYGCRAWVSFDGTRNAADTGASTNGANVKIRASGNVSSVLKNAVGDYTVNFTTAMPDASYAATLGWSNLGPGSSWDGSASIYSAATVTTSSVRVFSSQGITTETGEEAEYFAVAIFR